MKSQTNTGPEGQSAVPKTSQRKPDKSYGWIPYPKTKMNYFYNQVCESLFSEMTPFLSGPKSQFMKMFHAEARREYTIEKKVEHEKSKIEHLQSQKDPSQAGFLLQKERVPKPHDINTIQLNYSKITKIKDNLEQIQEEVKQDLTSTIHVSGRIKTGKKTAHNYDEKVLTITGELLAKLDAINSDLLVLEERNKRMFKVSFASEKRKSRMKKQNKRRSLKRKANRKATRQRELLKVIAPALKEGEICTISDIDETSVGKITGKRKIKFLHSLIEPDCRMLDTPAKERLKQLQGPNRHTVDENGSDFSEDRSFFAHSADVLHI